jgi:hypothetical protein
MALGDGVRRNVALVSQQERDLLLDAFLKLDKNKIYPDGVTYWDKQEDIHKNAHFAGVDVHGGPAFIPWHRVIVNRLEALLREIHPELSLHYWDWTTDPTSTTGGRANLFTPQFMGHANGNAGGSGEPFEHFESTEGASHTVIWRGLTGGPTGFHPDADFDAAATFVDFDNLVHPNHDDAHYYIGGTLSDAHYSFHDPFVFLLHSNMDRLWAYWQTAPAHPERVTAAGAYSGVPDPSHFLDHVEPWAGGTGLEPWASDPTVRAVIDYYHPSVIAPPCYDTNRSSVVLDEVENPGSIIKFNDVPEGDTAIRAAAFRVYACDDVHFTVTAGPTAPYSLLLPPGNIAVKHTLSPFDEGRIWFAFTGTTANATAPSGTVTIHCVETNQDFHFTLTANTVHRPTVGAVLVLDQSGSMDWDAGTGPGIKRIDVLHEAASRFCDLVQANNGVGLVRFDQSAYPILPVQTFGASPFDSNRTATLTAVNATTPNGATSIGNGVALGRTTLNGVTGYDSKAMIVFTDGLENTPQYIADVMGMVDSTTYAIGLGTPQQISTAALNALTSATGGYLHISGHLTPGTDDYFLVSKYFLEILTAISNTDVVLDPSGTISPGERLRIPFVVSDTDIDQTVILMTDLATLPFAVETPQGDVITPANASGFGAVYAQGMRMSWYRLHFPTPLKHGSAHAGVWHALIEWDRRAYYPQDLAFRQAATQPRRVRYSLNVHAYSNLRMKANLSQNSLQPGATLTLRATLKEYGQPVDHRAAVSTQLKRPDGTTSVVALTEGEPGTFEVAVPATQAGIYHFRLMAKGVTWRGTPFTREKLLTGMAYPGGDGPFQTSGPAGREDDAVCRSLKCLITSGALRSFLEARGISQQAVLEALSHCCAPRPPTKEELDRREGTAPTAASGFRTALDQLESQGLLPKLIDLLKGS